MDNTTNIELIEKLYAGGGLCAEEYAQLITAHTPQEAQLLYSYADALRDKYYGKDVYLRGLIEFSSYCKNDCIYCGLRRSNTKSPALPSFARGYTGVLPRRLRTGLPHIRTAKRRGYALHR